MKKNKAKFFCENCGTEVPENAKFCKQCGKFFSAVRCPSCGATGNAADFAKGCPLCGYAVKNNTDFHNKKSNISHFSSKNNLNFNTNGTRSNFKDNFFSFLKKEHSLPPWIYIITSTTLLTLFLIFYSCIKNTSY